MHSSTHAAGITNLLSLVALNPVQLQQDQPPPLDRLAAPIIPQPAAAATDVQFAAEAGIQVAAGADRVPSQRRNNEPADQASERRSGPREIRRPRRFLDYFVPYFCSRKLH